MPRRRLSLLLLCGVCLHLGAIGWFAANRPIDGDEGYYGLAARLVAEGKRPYADFFYPQAPLLPYLYAPAAAVVGAPQLPDLRYVSVALSGLCLGVAAWWLRRTHAEHPGAALAALLLLGLSPELILWHSTVKTFAWTGLATLGGLVALDCALTRPARRGPWLLAGGLLFGLAVASRLLFAPVALVPGLWLLGRRVGRDPRGALWWFGGLAVGLAPIWVALARDPAVFWFNNVGYHRLRFSELEDEPAFVRRLAAIGMLGRSLATNPGLLAFAVLAAGGAIARRRRGDPAAAESAGALPGISLAAAVVHCVACLVPEPVHMQYFTGSLPVLLLPAAADGLVRLPRATAGRWRLGLGLAAPAICAISLGMIRHDVDPAPCWRLDHYRRVCRRIVELTRPRDTVLGFWSGYVGGSGRQPLPGFENHFAVGVSERLDPVRLRRYRIAGRHELADAFARETPAVVVIGVWMNEIDIALDNRQMTDLLAVFNAHYVLREELDGAKLCERATGSRR
ncbi:MAG TPA: hypothetical protein PLL30_02320 [Candidatus Krumholzibacteria bacterium]|nr:hypothetical protein [Candidatus Krumholzibacteria bacterium]HPD70603.1 hypothetical protein [Candidatus Krumholzibacteria bacterium]HRY39697.1 hypothetical protein [Candidatus Krumholzibacteria bacterium]